VSRPRERCKSARSIHRGEIIMNFAVDIFPLAQHETLVRSGVILVACPNSESAPYASIIKGNGLSGHAGVCGTRIPDGENASVA